MNLTEDEKMVLTETIAEACGYRLLCSTAKAYEPDTSWVRCQLPGESNTIRFDPFRDWNHAVMARKKLLELVANYSVSYVHYHTDRPWVQVEITIWIHPDCGLDPVYEGKGANELEALVMALVEIAKIKLEEE